jgi:cytochrome c553
MSFTSSRLMIQRPMVAMVFATSGYADDISSVSSPGLQAKMEYCKTCHGLSGQGYRGAFPMRRLAGQQTDYIENQLKGFTERRRTNPVMFSVAHAPSPASA